MAAANVSPLFALLTLVLTLAVLVGVIHDERASAVAMVRAAMTSYERTDIDPEEIVGETMEGGVKGASPWRAAMARFCARAMCSDRRLSLRCLQGIQINHRTFRRRRVPHK